MTWWQWLITIVIAWVLVGFTVVGVYAVYRAHRIRREIRKAFKALNSGDASRLWNIR